MAIKAIFARIFSVICFAIMVIGIRKIIQIKLNKNISNSLILFGLLLLPNVLYHATCIRMYAFGAMLITWELTYLAQFNKLNKIQYLIYATIFAALAAWTHYFAAIIAGLLLLYEFIAAIFNKNLHKVVQFGCAGICMLLLFIPWGLIAATQVSSVGKHFWIKFNLQNFVDIFYYRSFPIHSLDFLGFILLLIFTIIVFKNGTKQFNALYKRILFSFYGAMIIGISISIIVRPLFQSRYLFFIFPLYLVLTILGICMLPKTSITKWLKIGTVIFLSFGILFNCFEGVCNVKRDFNVIKYTKQYNAQKSKDVVLPFNNDTCLTTQYSLYLPNKTIISNSKIIQESINTGKKSQDTKLFNILFPNFKFINH